MKNINYICSLGTLCHSAKYIKDNNTKKCSYPFDWIFSNPHVIIKIIKNDFVDFLNKEHYKKINDKKCDHDLYGGNMFNHHNPLNEKDHEYFKRCVVCFKELLDKKNQNFF